MRYGNPMSADLWSDFDRELGAELGLSPETVRRASQGLGFRFERCPVPARLGVPSVLPGGRRPLPEVRLRAVPGAPAIELPGLPAGESRALPRATLRRAPVAHPQRLPDVPRVRPVGGVAPALRPVVTEPLGLGPPPVASARVPRLEPAPEATVSAPERLPVPVSPESLQAPDPAVVLGRWDALSRAAAAEEDLEAQRFFVLASVVEQARRWCSLEGWLGAGDEDVVAAQALLALLDDERARRASRLLARPFLAPFEDEADRLGGFLERGDERTRELFAGIGFLEQRLGVTGAVSQEEYDRVRAELAASKGGYSPRLAALFFGGYYPWMQALATWAEASKLAVLYPSPGVDFSILARGESASFLEQVLFVIVASEQPRRSAWFARQNRGLPVGPRPTGSVGIAVLHFVDLQEQGDLLGARPSIFEPRMIDLAPLAGRLVDLAPVYRADRLYGFAPVRDRVIERVSTPREHLHLVPVSYDPDEVPRVVTAAAEILGVEAEIARA